MAAQTEETKAPQHPPEEAVEDQGKKETRRRERSSRTSSRSVETYSLGGRSRSRSQSAEPRRRHRSTSRSKKENLREKTSSKDRSRVEQPATGSGGTHRRERSKSREREKPTGKRSKSRERSRSRSHPQDREEVDDDASLVRRRRKTNDERVKASYVKSNNIQKKAKEQSKDRKSSVMGSLTAFLEESTASSSPRKSSDARSVVSSVSRRGRRLRASSASVVGGVVSTREMVRERRRSRSESLTNERKESHVGTSHRSSSLGKYSDRVDRSARQPRRSGVTNKNNTSSNEDGAKPLDEEEKIPQHSTSSFEGELNPSTGERSMRPQRRASMTSSNGVEIPHGFPVAAVDKNAAAGDQEDSTHSSDILDSTTRLRLRQQQRSNMDGGTAPSPIVDQQVDAFRKARRRSSVGATNLDASLAPALTNPETPRPAPLEESAQIEKSVRLEEKAPETSVKRKSRRRSSIEASKEALKTPDEKTRSKKLSSRKSSHASSAASAVPDLASPIAPKALKQKKPDILDTLEARLSQVRSSKGWKKSSKKSSGHSVATAPAISDKHSVSKRKSSNRSRAGQESKDKSLKEKSSKTSSKNPLESSTLSGLKAKNETQHKIIAEELMHSSMASLDPRLLQIPTSVTRISSIAEMYNEEDEEEQPEANEQSTPNSLGSLFQQEYGSPTKYNQSNVSFDSVQLQQVAAAFGGANAGGVSPHGSNYDDNGDMLKSPGCLRRKIGQATIESPQNDKRVSWVELPLNNPQALLVKSTDKDGKNETTTTTTADAMSSVDDDDDASEEREETTLAITTNAKSKKVKVEPQERIKAGENQLPKSKSNPSLDLAFSRTNKNGPRRQSADERTVGTTTTTSTSNTNASEVTLKTGNRSAQTVSTGDAVASSANPMSKRAEEEEGNKSQLSMTTGDLAGGESLDGGSSSSLSRSTNSSLSYRKSQLSDGSSSSLLHKSSRDGDSSNRKPSRHRSSKAHGGSRNKNRSIRSKDEEKEKRHPDSESREHRRQVESKAGSNRDSSRERRHRSSKRAGSETSSSSKKAGSKIRYIPSGSTDSQSSGEPTEEKTLVAKTKLLRNNSIGSDEGSKSRRRKSYLPRKTSKAETDKSKELKKSVNSSLDKFLAKLDDAPLLKDENRSVFSAIQDKDRKKRLRDRKKDDIVSRRVNRQGERARRGVDRNLSSTSDDNMSVASAPMLSSKQARKLRDERNRPIVNLKKTQFSKKMQKLDVAF